MDEDLLIKQLAQRIQDHLEQGGSPSVLIAQFLEEGLGWGMPMLALEELTQANLGDLKSLGIWFDSERRIKDTDGFDRDVLSFFEKS